MKRRKWNIMLGIATAVMISACTAKEETKQVDAWPDSEDQEWEDAEEETQEEPSDDIEEEIENVQETEEEEIPDWIFAYKDFLGNRENMVPLLLEEGEVGLSGFITGFYLYDLNGDDIPELFVQKDQVADYVYTYHDGNMELRNVISYDAFGESYFGYDAGEGQVYSIELSGGTGTDRRTGLSKISLVEETHDMGETVVAYTVTENGIERLYDAVYGDMEGEDGSYRQIEWKDAIPYEDSKITKDEFAKICENFVPFDFHEITEENIEAYVVGDYSDASPVCSLDEYRKKMEDKRYAFQKSGLPCEVKDGKLEIPDTAVLTEDWQGGIYYDVNLLKCYHENQLEPGFEEEWKSIYWRWLQDIDGKVTADGKEVVEDKEYGGIAFLDWKDTEAPVLWINAGAAAFRCEYFTIIDGDVVHITSDEPPMGYSITVFVRNTEYYFKYDSWMTSPSSSVNGASLNNVNSDSADPIWTVFWEEFYPGSDEEREMDTPEYGVDNPNCTLHGQQTTKAEAMEEVDKLLGSGAAEQLLQLPMSGEYWEPNNITGPLSFSGGYEVEFYPWDQLLDVFCSY